MHGPDGTDYDNHVVYERVERPELLTYQHGGAGQDPFDVTVTFDEFMGSCVLTLRSVFVSVEERDRLVAEVGAIDGAQPDPRPPGGLPQALADPSFAVPSGRTQLPST